MKSVLWFACLFPMLFASASLNAADVYVDENYCGTLSSLQVNGTTGRVDISTGSASNPCKIGTQEPPPAGTFALTATSPTGGTISSSPAGISCPGDCNENFAENATVTLSAAPNTAQGYSHGTWGGACSGPSSDTCNVTMSAAKNVSAAFTPPANAACPAGTTCITRNWPISTTETFSLTGSAVLSIKINTTSVTGLKGSISTGYTSGGSAQRKVAFSSSPGDFNVPPECLRTGNPSTVNQWVQGPTGKSYECKLPLSSPYYINIQHTDCGATSTCTFHVN